MIGLVSSTVLWYGDRVKAAVGREVDRRQTDLGRRVVARARELAPVDTGQLRDSIGFTYRQSDKHLSIYADMPYSVFQEYGTRFMAAHPFLRPAFNEEAGLVWGNVMGGRAEFAFPNTPNLVGTNRRPNPAHERHNRETTRRLEGLFRPSRRAGFSARRGRWNGPSRPWRDRQWQPPRAPRWDGYDEVL